MATSKTDVQPTPNNDDLGGEPENLDSFEDQPSSDDKPFDSEPFDAGVEADENSDPKKYIEQLTGKLGQSLRKYTENQGHPDFDLEKFAINSLLSATHTSEMDTNDQDDIIKKVKTAGNDDSEDSNSNDNDDSTNSGSDASDGDASSSGDDLGEPNPENQSSGEEVNEENNLFIEPKKNNMFQPHSNDILKNAVKESVKGLEKSGKSSIFGKIKSKLQETFNQEDETMSEPMIEPVVKPTPTTTPSEPKIAPNRKNKPFLPMPEVQPDPKAKK